MKVDKQVIYKIEICEGSKLVFEDEDTVLIVTKEGGVKLRMSELREAIKLYDKIRLDQNQWRELIKKEPDVPKLPEDFV